LSRNQSRWVIELLTGHCYLNQRLAKMGLTSSTVCKRCLDKDDSAIHILRICEAIACLTFCHLGHYFMKLDDCHDSTLFNVRNWKVKIENDVQWIIEGHGARARS
jgi:hypothetical protein